jgi:glycosyltransferase involved in cell wall biosynthesis
MKNPKIAYVRTKFWFNLKAGGSVGHTLGVLNSLRKNGCEIKIISSDMFLGIEDFDYKIIKPKIFTRRIKRLGEFLFNYYGKNGYLKAIADYNPDYIYYRHSNLNFLISQIAAKLKIPLILEFNGWTYLTYFKKNRLKDLVNRFFLNRIYQKINMFNFRNAEIIVVVSRPLKEDLSGMGINEKKILVSPNGVDLEKFSMEKVSSKMINEVKTGLSLKGYNKIIGFVGTFGAWHGIPQMVEAIKKINQERDFSRNCFLMVGDGLLKDFAVKELGKFENVVFTGNVSYKEIQYYLAACDILVSPHCFPPKGKKFYGSPTKLFEYMAMEKGIVASRLGQIGEVLEDQKTGILVEPENIDELSEGIIKLVEGGSLSRRLGKNARKAVIKNYTWDSNIIRLLDFLNNRKKRNN